MQESTTVASLPNNWWANIWTDLLDLRPSSSTPQDKETRDSVHCALHSEPGSLYFVRRTSHHDFTNFRTSKSLDFRFDFCAIGFSYFFSWNRNGEFLTCLTLGHHHQPPKTKRLSALCTVLKLFNSISPVSPCLVSATVRLAVCWVRAVPRAFRLFKWRWASQPTSTQYALIRNNFISNVLSGSLYAWLPNIIAFILLLGLYVGFDPISIFENRKKFCRKRKHLC